MPSRTSQSKPAETTAPSPTMRPRQSRKGRYFVTVLVLILALVAYYFFTKYQELKENPNAISEAEAVELSLEVGKIMVVPEDEVPTIATVSDPKLLEGQAFFKNAKKGDKVLIYSQAGRAILYDPEAKKIIEVAPIDNGSTSETIETVETDNDTSRETSEE